jgi:hypothetical protein
VRQTVFSPDYMDRRTGIVPCSTKKSNASTAFIDEDIPKKTRILFVSARYQWDWRVRDRPASHRPFSARLDTLVRIFAIGAWNRLKNSFGLILMTVLQSGHR